MVFHILGDKLKTNNKVVKGSKCLQFKILSISLFHVAAAEENASFQNSMGILTLSYLYFAKITLKVSFLFISDIVSSLLPHPQSQELKVSQELQLQPHRQSEWCYDLSIASSTEWQMWAQNVFWRRSLPSL